MRWVRIVRMGCEVFVIPHSASKAIGDKCSANEGYAASEAHDVEVQQTIYHQALAHCTPLQEVLHLAVTFACVRDVIPFLPLRHILSYIANHLVLVAVRIEGEHIDCRRAEHCHLKVVRHDPAVVFGINSPQSDAVRILVKLLLWLLRPRIKMSTCRPI